MAVIHTRPGDSYKGFLSVYKLDGSTVHENIEFNSYKTLDANLDVSIARSPATPIIAYSYKGPSGIENRLSEFGPDMKPLKEPLLFRRGNIYGITLSTIVYRKVFLAYNTPGPYFQIVSVGGESDVPETPFGPSMAKHMTSQLIFPLRSVLIAYADADNRDWGTFMIIDASGKIVQGPTVFEEGPVSSIAIQTTQYYRFALAYRTGFRGKLALYDYTDLMLEEVNPNQVRLTNNTGKLLSVELIVDP
jgi:hypothetical protein